MKKTKLQYIQEPNKSECGQACIAMVSGININEVENICGTKESISRDLLVSTLKQLKLYDSDYKPYRGILPPLCILHIELPDYGHCCVYYNGVFYDPEFGILDKYMADEYIKAYIPINNEKLLKEVELRIPDELSKILQNDEEANLKFSNLSLFKQFSHIHSINLRKNSKEKRAKQIIDMILK